MAGGGGAWKVAYADFVTAMMAFFLVMWIVAQNKPVKQAIAGYFKDPAAAEEGKFGKGRPGKEGDGGGFNMLAADDDDEGGGKRPALMVLSDTNDRHTGSMIRFERGSADLSDEAKDRLKELSALLAGKLNKVEVRGHVARPTSDDAASVDPWQLSYARATAVMKGLIELGIDPQRLRLSQAGSYEPLSAESDDAALAEDARVEVYALNEFADQYANGKKRRGRRPKVAPPSAEATSEY